jgi:hypothetical protein
LRVSLDDYFLGAATKVYSLVASVPFSPVDIDLNILARGEWDSLKDRVRVWFIPSGPENEKPSCYVMIRKLDPQQDVLVCVHIVMNLGVSADDGQPYFTVGILSNDDVRARATLGVFVGVPPIFHKRSEVRLKEAKWRTDSDTVMRFAANAYSAATAGIGPGGEVYRARVEVPPGFLADIGPGVDTWWEEGG